MQFEHEFTVPVPVEQSWEALLDVERVAPCMPGATVDSVDGDSFTGRVKVKVGPMTVAYAGTASFTEKDAAARRVVVAAKGRETRGAGTAAATVTAQLAEADAGTRVSVVTDLAITGRPAQFGRGVMDDVGRKLLGQFAECLAGQLAVDERRPVDSAAEAVEPTAQLDDVPVSPDTRPTSDTINLVQVAGGSVAKRLVPILVAVAVVVIGWLVVRGLRS
jgi:carbon monoxide dehydrogenase subunit G